MSPNHVIPTTIRALLFDMDGVLTESATLHAAAWKEMFDAYLQEKQGGQAKLFTLPEDYKTFMDGKLRTDGVKDFLASRGITLPFGEADDPPELETINGLGNRKNLLVHKRIASQGVKTFADAPAFIAAAQKAGYATALVSSSKNAAFILEKNGLKPLFSVCIDGAYAAEHGIKGKPAPDTYLEAAKHLGFASAACAVFEDALAGVQAGRAGAFGWVVGVDREGHAEALLANGADITVQQLGEIEVSA